MSDDKEDYHLNATATGTKPTRVVMPGFRSLLSLARRRPETSSTPTTKSTPPAAAPMASHRRRYIVLISTPRGAMIAEVEERMVDPTQKARPDSCERLGDGFCADCPFRRR